MSQTHAYQRTIWPLLSAMASIALYVLHQPALDAFQLGMEARTIRILSGSASYFSAAWLGGRLAGLALERSGPRKRQVPKLLLELVTAGLFIAAGVAALMLVIGQSLSGALAGSGLVIALLGFALRNALADVFSGIAVGIEAPYRIGDWVAIDDATRGRVIEIGWRTTRLLTRDDTYMILPNSQIARQTLINYSAPRRKYRAKVQVVLDHEISVADAKALLAEAAAKPSIIVASPRPDVRVLSYDAEGIRYHVRFWVPTFADDVDCRDAVLSEIDAALRARALPLPLTRLRLLAGGAEGDGAQAAKDSDGQSGAMTGDATAG
ncbi:mechanosensitive ion channel family protein [Bosea sp. 2KB_26]|uniref:mechanosensitive ion channel family protein n=1 Tax=Bosea sp. 2KB_26 TaxID=3237475 RepID=UPI003F93E474